MADNNNRRNRMETKKFTGKIKRQFTGKIKWLDFQGIGYIVPDNPCFSEVYVSPSSISSNIIREGDRVKFSLNLSDPNTIHSVEAVNVIPFGAKCSKCRAFGHDFLNCPQYLVSTSKCSRCGLIGHRSKNCDQKFRGWPFNKNKTHKRISSSYGDERFCDGRSWSSLFGKTHSGGVKVEHTSKSIVCVKKKKDVKKVEEVEDCFILEFDPTLDDDNDDDDDDVKSIVCVKKSEDVKKVEEVEDCFILDFDPFEDKFSNLSLCEKSEVVAGEDDVTILAAKGKVACRDYPHSRHLCATHPFKKTPHELHCKMCYCFICDIPAPCNNWNKGSKIPGLNHCDATDESLSWRMHRDLVKKQSLGVGKD